MIRGLKRSSGVGLLCLLAALALSGGADGPDAPREVVPPPIVACVPAREVTALPQKFVPPPIVECMPVREEAALPPITLPPQESRPLPFTNPAPLLHAAARDLLHEVLTMLPFL